MQHFKSVLFSLNTQDQEKLYSEMVIEYQAVWRDLHDFKASFENETSGFPELTKCVKILVDRCGMFIGDFKWT